MRRHTLGCAAVVGMLLLISSATRAQVPDGTSSLGSGFIDLQGTTNGLPDNCSDSFCSVYPIILRSAGVPLVGRQVVIDFSACSDMQISCTQVGPSGFPVTNLGGKQVSSITNALGEVTFTVEGAATSFPTGPSSPPAPGTAVGVPCAVVLADDGTGTGTFVPMANLRVAAYDVNSLGSPSAAVNSVDAFITAEEDAKRSFYLMHERIDYNHDANISVADIPPSIKMAAQDLAGTGSSVTAPYCP